MSRKGAPADDPRDLIGEAYRMEGISVEDCRSIFFDWALGLPGDTEPAAAAARLIAHHQGPEDHPMTGLLREAVEGRPRGRRGGWRKAREGGET